jgi:integrase
MTTLWTIERQVHFRHAGHGRGKQVREGPAPEAPALPAGRVPRVTKLMALALHFDDLLQSGAIGSYAELARLGHVTRARVCQIMNLVYLAPDIQEALLFLPRTERGRDRIILADLQPIAALMDWRQQRRRWAEWTGVRRRP